MSYVTALDIRRDKPIATVVVRDGNTVVDIKTLEAITYTTLLEKIESELAFDLMIFSTQVLYLEDSDMAFLALKIGEEK